MAKRVDDGASSDLVLVTWEDTTNIAAWQTIDDIREWATAGGWICHNIGWVIHEDANCIVLSARRCDDPEHHIGLTERIPRRAILKITIINDPGTATP